MGPVGSIGWVAFRGIVAPVDPKWGDVRPVIGTGRESWVHKLLELGVLESVKLQFCWS